MFHAAGPGVHALAYRWKDAGFDSHNQTVDVLIHCSLFPFITLVRHMMIVTIAGSDGQGEKGSCEGDDNDGEAAKLMKITRVKKLVETMMLMI